MSTYSASSGYGAPSGIAAALRVLADEASVLLGALLSPGKIIEEVEQMRALQVEADRIAAADPVAAATLRRRASRIGLR